MQCLFHEGILFLNHVGFGILENFMVEICFWQKHLPRPVAWILCFNLRGPLKKAQEMAAAAYGAQHTFFVTNGTSTANKIVVQALGGTRRFGID